MREASRALTPVPGPLSLHVQILAFVTLLGSLSPGDGASEVDFPAFLAAWKAAKIPVH